LKTATEGQSGRFSKMQGALYTQYVSLKQYLHANCPQMIQKKQWPPNSPNLNPCRYRVCGAMHETF